LLKLRTILLSNKLYLILLIAIIIITLIRINIPLKLNLNKTGLLDTYHIDGSSLVIKINNITGYYYLKTTKEKAYFIHNFNLGDKIKLEGTLTKSTYNKTTYNMKITNIIKIADNTNIYYTLKNLAFKRCLKNKYLNTFILGDKTYINNKVIRSYQENGISHLLAISGMHITLFSVIILKILKFFKIKEEKRYLITSIILIIYLSLTGLSPSILRGVLFFILFSLNKVFYFYIKSINIFILTLFISLLINPLYVYNIGFWYSFSISLGLIIMGNYINSYKHYFSKLLMTSLIAFIVSIPISLYNFYFINILSIIYNLFFVPLVSIIIFPLALISFLIPPLEIILNLFIKVLEETSLFLTNIKISKLVFCKASVTIYLLLIILVIVFLYGLDKHKYKLLIPLGMLLISHYLYPYLVTDNYLMMIDVGQGDSILLHIEEKNILIDTGGKLDYYSGTWMEKKNKYSVVDSKTIPLLRSLGIAKIDRLLLSHGDDDHMGDAINLVKDFRVDKVYINNGRLNSLENRLSKVVKVHKEYEGLIIRTKNLVMQELNKDLGEENDSSAVYLAQYKDIKMMFMGDATMKSETSIMNNYNLSHVNILKVGHHGSKTSSSMNFIKTIRPDIALISAGLNNKFKHPNQVTLNTLNKYKVKYYITFKTGNIKINLDTNKLTKEK
jgi:competence protein ComEC